MTDNCQCAIQACLTKSSYQEEKCQSQINALYECCNAFYKARGEDAKTPSCPKPNLLRLKMKQRGMEP
ncbi:Cx9C motif-containing protein 4, mitochondrial [Aspergillus niger]|nr:Cx9C motif-containing protein 4, mitochondrial [Aspergillus niger]